MVVAGTRYSQTGLGSIDTKLLSVFIQDWINSTYSFRGLPMITTPIAQQVRFFYGKYNLLMMWPVFAKSEHVLPTTNNRQITSVTGTYAYESNSHRLLTKPATSADGHDHDFQDEVSTGLWSIDSATIGIRQSSQMIAGLKQFSQRVPVEQIATLQNRGDVEKVTVLRSFVHNFGTSILP